jgi:hypothetical protein
MYDALKAIEGCPEIAVVMTGNISKTQLNGTNISGLRMQPKP